MRYFNIPVPKQYKNDLFLYIKTKDFVILAKERMNFVLSKNVNKFHGIPDSVISA